KREFLRDIADPGAGLRAGGPQIAPCNLQMATGGRQQPAKHPESGGLACAVGAKKPEYLTPRHIEGRAGDSSKIAELAHQITHGDHWLVVLDGLFPSHSPGRGAYPSVLLLLLAQKHHEGILKLLFPRFR